MTYGSGTRSYNRSTEAHQMKTERKKATNAWKPGEPVELLVACNCRYKPFPHAGHAELRDVTNWKPRG